MFRTLLTTLFLFTLPVVAADWNGGDWNSRSALEARRNAIISAEVGGRVVKIRKEMGEAFNKDDVLVELNDRIARANLASAKAALEAAAAALTAVNGMYERKNASQVELEEARRDAAEAAAKLEHAAYEAEACLIAAPFAGRVVEVLVNEHELVEKGRSVVSLIDDSVLTAKFLFPEEKFGQVAIGDVLDIDVPVAGVSRRARVSHIAPVLEPASRTLDVWASVDNSDAALRAGMTVVLAADGFGKASQ